VGVNIERRFGSSPADKSNLIKALQQVVFGRVSADRADTGLSYAPRNLLCLPKPHVDIFDDLPVLIAVPYWITVVVWPGETTTLFLPESYPCWCQVQTGRTGEMHDKKHLKNRNGTCCSIRKG
jgi:hypothetical protein